MTSDGRKIDDEAHQSHRLVDQFPSWIFLDELHRIVLQCLTGNLQCDEEKTNRYHPTKCQAMPGIISSFHCNSNRGSRILLGIGHTPISRIEKCSNILQNAVGLNNGLRECPTSFICYIDLYSYIFLCCSSSYNPLLIRFQTRTAVMVVAMAHHGPAPLMSKAHCTT